MPQLLLSVVLLTAAAFAFWLLLRPLFRRWVLWRLGGYVHVACQPEESEPLRLDTPRQVAVLGAGVAGLVAATTLARRGYQVALFEKNGYLGGKLGSWPVDLTPDRRVWVSHGFHAFFPHYYNLNRFLDSRGLRKDFESIGDYVILAQDGSAQRFANLDTTPVLNLISMWRAGAFTLADALRSPGRDCYGVFLEYDGEETFRRYDSLSFSAFAKQAQVPPRLLLAFNTFARAFFSDADRLSLAELIKSFHFYYLSQDGGLVYDYPTDDYEPALLAPLRAELESLCVELHLNTQVNDLAVADGGFTLGGRSYQRVVVATDVVGARHILSQAAGVPASLREQFTQLTPGQRYAVLRIWIDKPMRQDLPVFVITEKIQVLDSVTDLSRFERSTRRDAEAHGEHVLELHCYSVPDDLPDENIRGQFLEELQNFFPELAGMTVRHEVLQIKRDFTAFHVQRHQQRPETRTGVPGLVCAGDWVKLPFPAMLLEASCASGLWAANELLALDGLRRELVLSVPPRGLMAGFPEPPLRRRWLA